MSSYNAEISDYIHRADKKGETFIMKCEETPDNPDWQRKCEAMKKRALEMNKMHYFNAKITHTEYDDTSCTHHHSGCELNFDRSLFGILMHLKDKWFN